MKAVFFDLDGTLCDTLADLAASVNYALSALDLPAHSEAEVCGMVGNGVRLLCERAVPPSRKESAERVLSLFRTHYASHCTDRTQAYPGMADTLCSLSRMGYLLGVITNKPQSSAVRILDHVFGTGTFAEIIGQTEQYPTKPDPGSLLAVMQKRGLSPCDVTYVGDSDVDLVFGERIF